MTNPNDGSASEPVEVDDILEEEFGAYVQAANVPPPVPAFEEPVQGGPVEHHVEEPTSGSGTAEGEAGMLEISAQPERTSPGERPGDAWA